MNELRLEVVERDRKLLQLEEQLTRVPPLNTSSTQVKGARTTGWPMAIESPCRPGKPLQYSYMENTAVLPVKFVNKFSVIIFF